MTIDPMDLPAAATWKASWGGTPGLLAYLGREGGPTMAIAFAAFFWPAFVEVRGCVLLVERYDPEYFEQWFASLDGDVPRIEAVINHTHLWDIFDPEPEAVPEDALWDLARVLRKTWSAAVAERFPGRAFDVDLTDDYGPTLSVHSA